MSFLWMFQSFRDLWQENQRLLRVVSDLEHQLERKIQLDPNVNEVFRKYQEEALQEIPYEGGKIPDDVWLTPGDERDR